MPIRFSALFALSLFLALPGHAQKMATNATVPAAPAPAPSVDPASQALADAMAKANANDMDGALAKLTEAIQLNPKMSMPYVLRASVYSQKKLWPQAEQDFETAVKLDPTNVVIQLNLVEVKFMQKQYDAARPGYVALVSDHDMGDFAAYKVFLCDLLGGHEAQAKKELDAFNQAGTNPSYYIANAAWDLVHKDVEKSRPWFDSAVYIYSDRKLVNYVSCLKDLGYLPLPPPPKK